METNIQEVENTDFDTKAAKKFFSRVGLIFFIGTVISLGVQYLSIGAASLFKADLLNDGNSYMFVIYVPLMLIGYPLFILLIKKFVPESNVAFEQNKMSVGQILIAFLMIYPLMYLGNIIGVITTFILSLIKNGTVENGLLNTVMNTNIFTQLIIMVIAAPIFEEYIFRKLLVDRLIRYGEGTAIVLSGLIFGLFHGNFSQFFYAFAIGCFFAYIYIRTGNVKYTITLHMIINFTGSVLASQILKLIDYEQLTRVMSEDKNALLPYIADNAIPLLIYLIYVMLLLAICIIGIVLLIVMYNKFHLEKKGILIPKGQRFKVTMVNAGMIIYFIAWCLMFILSVIS